MNHKTRVFVNGCFDVLHYGHIYLLRYAYELACNEVVVAINSDESIKRLKGNDRPINREFYRAETIASIRYVSRVIIFNEDNPCEVLKKLCEEGNAPHFIVKGYEYIKKEDQLPEIDIINQYGIVLAFVPHIHQLSTSEILSRAQ